MKGPIEMQIGGSNDPPIMSIPARLSNDQIVCVFDNVKTN
jgi:hypothetical protein